MTEKHNTKKDKPMIHPKKSLEIKGTNKIKIPPTKQNDYYSRGILVRKEKYFIFHVIYLLLKKLSALFIKIGKKNKE